MTDEQDIGLEWKFNQFDDDKENFHWWAKIKCDDKQDGVDIFYEILENGEWKTTPVMKNVDLPLLIHHFQNVAERARKYKQELGIYKYETI